MKLVIATNNKKKLNEIRQCLPASFEVFTLSDLNIEIDVEETGHTFSENAALKAKAIYELCNLTVIADDSGLEVETLNGAPGIYSARFAGEQKSDEANNIKLLEVLKNVSNRKARFVCVIALYNGKKIEFFEGFIDGNIAVQPSGTGGFGYDPLFVPDGYNQSFAQLPHSLKNEISHRAKALQTMAEFLTQHPDFI